MDDHLARDIRTAKAFYEALLALQYESPERMQAYQRELLQRLLKHAHDNIPYYRQSLAALFDDAGALRPHRLDSLPFLTKAIVKAEGEALVSSTLPENLGISRVTVSGGSTGAPVRMRLTELENFARSVAIYRMFHWYALDCALPLAMLRKKHVFASNANTIPARKWGLPWLPEDQLGDRLFLDVSTPAEQQLSWLAAQPPLYVNTLPSNILSLCFATERTGVKPPIKAIVSVAEKLTPDIRDAAKDILGCRLIDIFSSSEGGVIAIECPESGLFHIQGELSCIEVLTEDGAPCKPGDVGEVVVTSFYNYAMPLIRYRSGDYVELGGQCSCGRQLPTIARMVGRREHLFDFADGSMEMPPIDRLAIARAVGNLDWCLVQTEPHAAEFRHAGLSPLGDHVEMAVRTELAAALPQGFGIAFRHGIEFPPISGGKKYFLANDIN